MLFVTLVTISTVFSVLRKCLTKRKCLLILKSNCRLCKTFESFSVISANKRLFSAQGSGLKVAECLLFVYIMCNVSVLHYEAISSGGFVGYRGWKNTFIMNAMKDSKYFTLPMLYRSTILLL